MSSIQELNLKYLGMDSWDRPVYSDPDGNLWKDVDPRPGMMAILCSASNNDFDGEPDTPMEVIYKQQVQVSFEPCRITWT